IHMKKTVLALRIAALGVGLSFLSVACSSSKVDPGQPATTPAPQTPTQALVSQGFVRPHAPEHSSSTFDVLVNEKTNAVALLPRDRKANSPGLVFRDGKVVQQFGGNERSYVGQSLAQMSSSSKMKADTDWQEDYGCALRACIDGAMAQAD